jgi:hypothetical protein
MVTADIRGMRVFNPSQRLKRHVCRRSQSGIKRFL